MPAAARRRFERRRRRGRRRRASWAHRDPWVCPGPRRRSAPSEALRVQAARGGGLPLPWAPSAAAVASGGERRPLMRAGGLCQEHRGRAPGACPGGTAAAAGRLVSRGTWTSGAPPLPPPEPPPLRGRAAECGERFLSPPPTRLPQAPRATRCLASAGAAARPDARRTAREGASAASPPAPAGRKGPGGGGSAPLPHAGRSAAFPARQPPLSLPPFPPPAREPLLRESKGRPAGGGASETGGGR